ncbi:nuclease SbcCD subunit C [Agarivorans sp. Toyoura001]|uniref:AAA family ATPase n=1 Tax=Agarivorans sp. Toyoura001 TaxID=2283141 RepID=UPI0010EC1EB0|nr:SMC family ATPase [Agarivorans sp. Toyoura001]GDY27522.1 nuclease SbcCD subunit C [Agarivorans sp. Toyoura001]
MRPISLRMSAFGPFAGTEFIDFSQLGRNPLFLLNGPTGAGKTTILDAMCFALYGKSTGDEREAAQMRCDLADESLLTEVVFEFELGQQRYRIRRVPDQERLKKSGDGVTKQKPEAQLSKIADDGSETLLVPAKVSEANTEIEALTGLDADQFRQVMVLPQGKFRQLLMADSKEREKIFSQLFQTHIYRKIEDSLKSQAASIRNAAAEQKNIREGILQSADLSQEQDLQEELATLDEALNTASNDKAQSDKAYDEASKQFEVAKLLSADFEQQTSLKASLALLTKQKPSIDKQQLNYDQAKAARAIEKFDTDYRVRFNEAKQASLAQTQSETELSQAKQSLDDAERLFKQVPEKEAQLNVAQEQLRSLQSFKPLLEELNKFNGLHKAEQQKLDLQAEQGKALKQQLSDTTEQKAKLLQQQSELRQQADTQAAKQKILGVAEQSVEQGKQLAALNKQLAESQQAMEQSAEQGKRLREQHQHVEQFANQTEFNWHQGQAAIMAKRLNQGDACPVCGSQEHPHLAASDGELPSEADVKHARESEQQAKDKLVEARQQYLVLKAQLSEWEGQQQNIHQQMASKASLSLPALIAELEQAQQALAIAQQAHKKVDELQQQIEQTTHAEQALQNKVELAKDTYRNIKEQMGVYQAQQERAEQNLPEQYREPQLLEQAIEQQSAKTESLKQNIITVNQAYNAAREALSAKQSGAAAAKQSLKLAQQTLGEAKTTFSEQLAGSCFDNEGAFNIALNSLSDEEFSELEALLLSFNQNLTKTTVLFEQVKAKLKGKKQQNVEALKQALVGHLTLRNQHDVQWNKLNSRQQTLQDIQQKLLNADKNAESLQAKYNVVGTLADVANGQTGNKISLQRFVLSVLLDDVLLQASQRLQLMSKGRYQLIRKEQRAKGNKASGLELEVEDSYTSKVRSVATLSGGESFMAALAMALGLSDVVQAYAGGIKLDTLFIDEGFGSLDQESLDLAIRTLIDLQSSGRMVGVISHVAEMKEQITSRIDVLKQSGGSTTHIVMP